MGTLYTTFVGKWQQATGGALFNQFCDVSQYSIYGSWGALTNIMETSSPKYDALMNLIAARQKALSASHALATN